MAAVRPAGCPSRALSFGWKDGKLGDPDATLTAVPGMIHARTLSAAALALLAAACPNGRDGAASRTALTLRDLAAGLDAHRERAGSLPASMYEVCEDSFRGCPGFPPGARLEDAWGRSIIYTRTEQSYLLQSLGPDGRSGTGDDLTVSPELEHARRRAFAGCYQVVSSGVDVAGFLELDTVQPVPGSALYPVRGAGESYFGWMPLTDETVEIMRFDSQHSTAVIQLARAPAGLSGRRLRRGLSPVDVLATRVPCPGNQPRNP